ncbi:MAG: hypothetical protein ABH803_03675 [Candidatus Micrarchaeota archaeon]
MAEFTRRSKLPDYHPRFVESLFKKKFPLPDDPILRKAVLGFTAGASIPLAGKEREEFIKKYFFEKRSEIAGTKAVSLEPKFLRFPLLVREGGLDLINLIEKIKNGKEEMGVVKNITEKRYSLLRNALTGYKNKGFSFKEAFEKTRAEAECFSNANPLERYIDFLLLRHKPFLTEVESLFN